MPSTLGFHLHSSQDTHGICDLFARIEPPVILIHLESKNDDLLTRMRGEWSPGTFVVGRLGMDRNEQSEMLGDPDPESPAWRLAFGDSPDQRVWAALSSPCESLASP